MIEHCKIELINLLLPIWRIKRQEAMEIVNDSVFQKELQDLKTPFKLISGNYYYLYENKSKKKKFFSLISPDEWNNNIHFLGKYFYDYDKQFILVN